MNFRPDRPSCLPSRGIVFIALCAACYLGPATRLRAGLTGENVALIVNGSSVDSLTVANHYAQLRDIPPQNIIVLNDVPDSLTISLDTFRDLILKPTLETINARRIAAQVSVIAYSAGFPTSVDVSSLKNRLNDGTDAKYRTPTASINSLTYFYRLVLSDSPDFMGWGANFYARGAFERHFANPFVGEPGEQFQSAIDANQAERFDDAAETFETLADEYPTLYPLRILAAENWLRGGNEDKALAQVRQAIQHGWVNRRYLIETEPLAKLFGGEASEMAEDRRKLLARLQDVPRSMQGPVGFSAVDGWTGNGHAVPQTQGGMPYLLSCVLAVIHEHGSTVPRAIESLQLAATADRTYPDAIFGFSKTNDVRSTTRFPVVPDAIAWLLARDKKVEIFPSTLPTAANAYVGLMLGSATLPFADRKWSFAPGAIAENLTSYGGVFSDASQTKLTSLLDAGAAMSSGTVTEPYALAPKFPTAMTYPYYSEGVTAIEAFYLSVQSPYQLLIVGDPLCQPYARAPNDFVRIETVASPQQPRPEDAAPGEPASGDKGSPNQTSIDISFQALPNTPASVATIAMDFYLNGKLAGRARPTPLIHINLPEGADGVVDIRVVLVGDHATHPHISTHAELVIGDPSRLPQVSRLPSENSDEMVLSVASEGADRIDITHLGRVIGTLEKASGQITLKPTQIGRGPVRLQAVSQKSGHAVAGRTVELNW